MARSPGVEPPPAAAAAIQAFRDTVAALAGGRLPVAEEVRRVRCAYEPLLAANHDVFEARRRDLEQLEVLAGEAPSRERFLTDLVLDPPDGTGGFAGPPEVDEEWTTLSTIRSAKGREWDAVFVIHAADGFIPSDLATGDEDGIEEERRLPHAALTRAKRHLEVVFPLRYHDRTQRHPGRHHRYAQLTRFIPPDLFPLCERHSPTEGAAAAAGEDLSPVIDPRERLLRLFEDGPPRPGQ